MYELEQLAGPQWAGWTLKRHGRSKEFFLFSPTGERYTTDEIAGLRHLQNDLIFLQGWRRDVGERPEIVRLSMDEVKTISRAASILSQRIREWFSVDRSGAACVPAHTAPASTGRTIAAGLRVTAKPRRLSFP